MKIRYLNESDANIYREVRLRGLKESPLAFRESFEDECEKSLAEVAEELVPRGNPPEEFKLGAFSERGELIGIVSFRRDIRVKARHRAMLSGMYVIPEARRQGVGRALLDQVVNKAEQLGGMEQIHLWVLHAMPSASGFYQDCGFAKQGPSVKGDLKIGSEYVDSSYLVFHLKNSG